MNQNVQKVVRLQIDRTMAALEKNNIKAYYAPTAADVPALVRELLPAGCTVSHGGTETLAECGVIDLLKTGGYDFLDRAPLYPGGGKALTELYAKVFSTDAYLTSANAVTEHGELVNVDGTGNRVAAIAYGPAQVIVVAGCNKLVPDLAAASMRLKRFAAPANAVRLSRDTYCAKTGHCIAIDRGEGEILTAGCDSPQRLCGSYLVCAKQRAGRMHVILVGEPLGF